MRVWRDAAAEFGKTWSATATASGIQSGPGPAPAVWDECKPFDVTNSLGQRGAYVGVVVQKLAHITDEVECAQACLARYHSTTDAPCEYYTVHAARGCNLKRTQRTMFVVSNQFTAHGCCGCTAPRTTASVPAAIAATPAPQTTAEAAATSTTAPAATTGAVTAPTTRNWPDIPAPATCTTFPAAGVGYSGPVIGDPVAGVHGHACAVLCSMDKRCSYWLVHAQKGCVLKT